MLWKVFSQIVNPVDHHSARIRKMDKDTTKKLDFKDIKFLSKVRDISKIEKKLHQH